MPDGASPDDCLRLAAAGGPSSSAAAPRLESSVRMERRQGARGVRPLARCVVPVNVVA